MARVVITGTGLVTAAGLGGAPLRTALDEKRSFRTAVSGLPLSVAPVSPALLYWPDHPDWAPAREFAGFGSRLALTAAAQALAEAAADAHGSPTERAATVAVCGDDWTEQERFFAALGAAKTPATEPVTLFTDLDDHFLLRSFRWGIGYGLAALSGYSGPSVGVDPPSCCGLVGLRHGLDLLTSGEVDRVLVVGVDTIPRVDLATEIARAFSEPPVFGQAAAALVLERSSAATARGVRALAEVVDCRICPHDDLAQAETWLADERARDPGDRWYDPDAIAPVSGLLSNSGAIVGLCLATADVAADASRARVAGLERLWGVAGAVATLAAFSGAEEGA